MYMCITIYIYIHIYEYEKMLNWWARARSYTQVDGFVLRTRNDTQTPSGETSSFFTCGTLLKQIPRDLEELMDGWCIKCVIHGQDYYRWKFELNRLGFAGRRGGETTVRPACFPPTLTVRANSRSQDLAVCHRANLRSWDRLFAQTVRVGGSQGVGVSTA